MKLFDDLLHRFARRLKHKSDSLVDHTSQTMRTRPHACWPDAYALSLLQVCPVSLLFDFLDVQLPSVTDA